MYFFDQYPNKVPTAYSRVQWCTYDTNRAFANEVMNLFPFLRNIESDLHIFLKYTLLPLKSLSTIPILLRNL